MRGGGLALAGVLSLLAAACAEERTPVQSPPTTVDEPPVRKATHAIYPLLSLEDLQARANEAEARSPGWTIALDCVGLLASASCAGCASPAPASASPTFPPNAIRPKLMPIGPIDLTDEDRARVDEFICQEDAIVARSAPFVEPHPRPFGFGQKVPFGFGGGFSVMRNDVPRAQLGLVGPFPNAQIVQGTDTGKCRGTLTLTDRARVAVGDVRP